MPKKTTCRYDLYGSNLGIEYGKDGKPRPIRRKGYTSLRHAKWALKRVSRRASGVSINQVCENKSTIYSSWWNCRPAPKGGWICKQDRKYKGRDQKVDPAVWDAAHPAATRPLSGSPTKKRRRKRKR